MAGAAAAAESAGGWTPLPQPASTLVVDQNGIPHILTDTADDPSAAAGLKFVNERLAASGSGLDENGTGAIYVLQDDGETLKLRGNGVITGADGRLTVTGVTADAVKIWYVDGRPVRVETHDFTEGLPTRNEFHVKTMRNKVRTDSEPGAKQQTQYVVFVAVSEAQYHDMCQRIAGEPNFRIIYPDGGLDSGEVGGPAPVSPPAGPAGGTSGAGTVSSPQDVLNLVRDLYRRNR